jgi:hypothetical protein
MPTGKWRNVHRSDPCGVCGKGDWCSRTTDRAWALCRRVDAGGQRRLDRAGMEYWLHRLAEGPVPPPEVPEEMHSERATIEDLDRVYRAFLRDLTLSDAHREALLHRGLDPEGIERGGYRSLLRRGRAELARNLLQRFPKELLLSVPGLRLGDSNGRQYLSVGGPPGLVVPVRDLAGRVVALKVRRDEEDAGPKYLYVSSTGHGGPGPGAPVHVPLRTGPPEGASEPVRVTEGELKADIATHRSGILTISVPGVSAWRSAIPVLNDLSPSQVLLAFDGDAATNPSVQRAARETASALTSRGYDVVLETWDWSIAKGIDDALLAGLAITVVAAGSSGQPPGPPLPADAGAPHQPVAHPYKSSPSGLVWVKPTPNGPVSVPLTNFRATIVTDVLDDDGAEISRRFEVEARLNGFRRRFTIGAETFTGMGWATEQLGARAVIYPGMGLRDHARAAVQLLSGEVPERHVYTHTGWRQSSEEWVYLHGGGALGAGGPAAGFEVALPDALSGLALPGPPGGGELIEAIRASLSVADIAPDPISCPLLGAAYRAVFGDVDFALHLAGPTGAGKSELAALVQRHFGPGLDARHLPGSWSSTANALELLAFSAKDALLVVDDFAPGGQSGDVERAHRDADRVLRAQGNRAGRLRMRADGTLRAARPPRGLILSTGEDIPRGQSIRARMLACELGPDDLRWAALTASQKDAAEGRLAQALSGFVCWIAPQRESLQAELRAWLPELRETAAGSATHRRTPEIVANLAAGWSYFLTYAMSAGAITDQERGQLWTRVWDALGRAASTQSYHQRGTEPAQRFLELLASAIGSGRAHLAGPDGNRPAGGAWGWRKNQGGEWEPKGERIGWLVEGDHVYLDADVSYAVVQRLGQEVGDRLPVTPQTLRKRLKERGVLVSTDTTRQVLTVRKVLEGQRREVLHLSGTILCPSEPF